MIRSAFLIIFLALAGATAASGDVVFVDNRATPGGNGTRQWPFTTISQGVQSANSGSVVYVAETPNPYIESVTLKKGQMLIGSAFGLDAVRTELKFDTGVTGVPAQQGTGPAIHGTIVTAGDNVIAGCTVFAEALSGIVGSGAIGKLTVRNVYFKTTKGGFGIYLQEQQGNVDISGGSIEASDHGSGFGMDGGYGVVVIDRMPISGEFTSAVRIQGRKSGSITFRRGTKLHVRDAFDDAVVIAGIERPGSVVFEDTIDVRGRRRGLVVNKVARLVIGGASTLSTANGAALEVHDSGVELSFESVSAQGIAPGTLDEGIILDGVHGKVSITGVEGKRGSGGAILHARGNGMRIVQSSNIRISGITVTDSGVNKPTRGVKCVGNFQENSTAVCRAALYLRHISDSTFENIVVDGGSAMGINANNIRDVTFGGLDVHGAGDETFESGVLLQEAGGTITFSRSSFVDNAGSEMLIEQRYNNGRIVLDRCTLAATGRPEVAPHLLEVRTFGASRIGVELRTADLKDDLGSAIDAVAGENSSLSIEASESSMQHFGHGVVTVGARQNGNAQLTLRGNSVVALVSDRAWVDVAASDMATACVDLTANRFSSMPGTVIRLAASARSSMRVIGAPSSDGKVIAAMVAAANGGAVAVVEGAVVAAPACHAATMPAAMAEQPTKSLFDKLKRGLFMTHTEIIEKVRESMVPDLPIEQSAIDGLEEGLLGADVGAELTTSLVNRIEQRIRTERITKMDRFTEVLREEARALIPRRLSSPIDTTRAKPFVILVVGVNGTGKTTTIAKLATRFRNEGKSVLLGAADTFRAAAIEQLQLWADRIGIDMVKHKAGSDPGAVAHDTVTAAKARGIDVVLIDTAGRLHNKSHLMQELSKVRRVVEKELPGAPHETLLVIDGTTGQNGVSQAAAFLEAVQVTGMIVTKLDGTAKGGVILSIMRQFEIPVKFVGVGESADDLIPFDPAAYVDTLFE